MSGLLSRYLVAVGGAVLLSTLITAPLGAQSNVRPVKLLELSGASGEQTRTFPAVIDAGDTANLNFSVGGRLVELPIKEAQEVKAGQLIARLDAKDFESKKTSAQAEFENAEQEYQRAVRLDKEDAISKKELEQRKSRRDVAKAQLETAEKALADTVIKAPFAGVLSSVPVKELQNVGPGEVICTLINNNEFKATIDLPAAVVTKLPKDREENAFDGIFVVLDAAQNEKIPAKFKEASLEADPTSQTFGVTFTFAPPEDLILLPGMNANVILIMSQQVGAPDAITVPLAAIMADGDQQYVWVVDPEAMTVSKRQVTVKDGIGDKMTILQGLTPGETIVGAGAAYLSEGMKVRRWEP